MGKIVVQLHRQDVVGRRHLVHLLAERWRQAGHTVEYVRGPADVEGDVLFHHVASSRVPGEYLKGRHRCRQSINSGIADIRKHAWMVDRLTRRSRYQGPVIVKTTLNYSGWDEAKLGLDPYEESGMKRPVFEGSTWEWLPPAWRKYPEEVAGIRLFETDRKNYRIFRSFAEVPPVVFRCPALVVQPFRVEKHGGRFCLREWYFLGSASHLRTELSPDPVFTSGTYTPELSRTPPPEVAGLRRRLKLDYGKIDYALVDGKPMVFDVNKTIGTAKANRETTQVILDDLSAGINDWL